MQHKKTRFKRKRLRLEEYDYSQNGAYFLTLCTQNRQECLSEISQENDMATVRLSEIGALVEAKVLQISTNYLNVSLDGYVIMPNHIHMILTLESSSISISRIIKQLKGVITKELGFSIWQKSFHDHVIRNYEDYLRLYEYIENNPAQWALDSLNPINSP